MSNVQFRRINGRIVPIKQKGMSTNDKVKTAVATTAGLGVGAAYGVAAGNYAHKANVARSQAKHFQKSAEVAKHLSRGAEIRELKKAMKFKLRTVHAARDAKMAKGTGRLLSTGLFAYAAHKVLDRNEKLKDNEAAKTAASAAVGVAGTLVTDVAMHAREHGTRATGKMLGKEAMKIAKAVAKFSIKRLVI